MGFFLVAAIALAAFAWYVMTPEERQRVVRAVVDRSVMTIRTGGRTPDDAFHALLLERTRRAFAAPACVAACAAVWVAMLFTAGSTAERLVAWGASYPPRTTNGEWWRLATYMFVHGSALNLLASLAALLPLGMYLERLVGRVAFLSVYLASGMVAGTVNLWTMGATVITDGSSGAVFGLAGLLLAVLIHGYLRSPRLPASTAAFKRLASGLGLFAGWNLVTSHLGTPGELAGMATGLLAGTVLARDVVTAKPALRRSAIVPAVAVVVAVAAALPLHGIVDARPLLARITQVETETAAEYTKAVDAYTHGRLSARALAQVIQLSILPALEADRDRIAGLRGVPSEQQALLADARRYFDLRESSWHQRVDGLLGSKMKLLRSAEQAERGALEALERVQRDVGTTPTS